MKRKIFILVLFVSILFLGSSCGKSSYLTLKKALKNSNTTNFSYVVDTKMKLSYESETQTQLSEIDIKSTAERIFMSTTVLNQTVDVYEEIDGDSVLVYTKVNNKWSEPTTISLEEALDEIQNIEIIDLSKDDFKYEDGVWVGNTASLQDKIDEALKKFKEQFEEMGIKQMEITWQKYNLTIEDKYVDTLEMDFRIRGILNKRYITIEVSMEVEYYDWGTTIVSKPSNLPE